MYVHIITQILQLQREIETIEHKQRTVKSAEGSKKNVSAFA